MKTVEGMKALATALLLTWLPSVAMAEDEGIATDRPDFVESSDVVGKGVWQIETSVAYERDKQAGVKTRVATTPTLLRFGVSDTLEARLETAGFTRQTVKEDDLSSTLSGFSDLSLGVKWKMREADPAAGRPGIAWLAHVDVNSGARAFRGQAAVPSLRMVAEWDLPGDVAVGVMPGVAWQRDDRSRYWSGIFAATVSAPLSDRMRGFVEIAGRELRSARRGGNQVTIDGGLTYAIDKDTQLDAAIMIGANRQTPDAAITFGFSKRFR